MFDVLVAGDGELAVLRAVAPDNPKAVDSDKNGGKCFLSDKVYDTTPTRARHLVDLQSYRYSIEGFSAASLIAQLGHQATPVP
jgi:hypothetical protein